jgi:hypothetical protein
LGSTQIQPCLTRISNIEGLVILGGRLVHRHYRNDLLLGLVRRCLGVVHFVVGEWHLVVLRVLLRNRREVGDEIVIDLDHVSFCSGSAFCHQVAVRGVQAVMATIHHAPLLLLKLPLLLSDLVFEELLLQVVLELLLKLLHPFLLLKPLLLLLLHLLLQEFADVNPWVDHFGNWLVSRSTIPKLL